MNKVKHYSIEFTLHFLRGLALILHWTAMGAARLAVAAGSLYTWARLRLKPPVVKPKVTRIPVRQLGLKTGQIVTVRRPRRIKIEVKYVRGE